VHVRAVYTSSDQAINLPPGASTEVQNLQLFAGVVYIVTVDVKGSSTGGLAIVIYGDNFSVLYSGILPANTGGSFATRYFSFLMTTTTSAGRLRFNPNNPQQLISIRDVSVCQVGRMHVHPSIHPANRLVLHRRLLAVPCVAQTPLSSQAKVLFIDVTLCL